jgi:N-acetylglucosamine-6-phosphate deacetylase
MPTTLTARRLLTEHGQIDFPVLTLEDGLIHSIEPGAPNGSDETLTASFLDIMAATAAEIAVVGGFLASRGVAHYLPTTVTGPLDLTLRALETLANAIENPLAGHTEQSIALPVGIHLEGPFVSHAKRGVHPVASILEPSVALFDRFQQAARGHIRLLTLAPELPHAATATPPPPKRSLPSPPAPPAPPISSTPCARSTTASPALSAPSSIATTYTPRPSATASTSIPASSVSGSR